jgi:hypothetical protein
MNLLYLDMATWPSFNLNVGSSPSLGLVGLLRIWGNLKVINIVLKISQMPNNGTTGAIRSKNVNLWNEERMPFNEVATLATGRTSAVKLKNAKAASHATHRPSSWRTRKRHLTPHIGLQVEERESGTSRHTSAIKLKNAKAAPHAKHRPSSWRTRKRHLTT